KLRVTPQILGNNVVDQALSLTAGTWDGSTPIAFTYSWRRCNPVGDLGSCVQIPGATAASYVPQVADIGFSIRVWITGSNVAGAAATSSARFTASTSPAAAGTTRSSGWAGTTRCWAAPETT